MNKRKGLAILFSILSFTSIQETLRIFTSSDSDIADNRMALIPIAVVITCCFIYLAIRFWNKPSKEQQ